MWQTGLATSVTKATNDVTVGFDGVTNMKLDTGSGSAAASTTITVDFTETVGSIALNNVATLDGSQAGGSTDNDSFLVGITGTKLTTLNVSGSLDNTTASTTSGYTGYGMLGLGVASSTLSKLTTINVAMTTNADLGLYGGMVTALTSNVTTLDGSASTGGLVVGLSGAATNATKLALVKTGSGDDQVALDLGLNTTALNVDLGSGSDELSLKSTSVLTSNQITLAGGLGEDSLILSGSLAKALYATTTKTSISGFEVLHIQELADATDAAKLSAYSKFVIEGAVSGNAGDLFNLANAADVTFVGDLSADATLVLQSSSGSSDSINLTFKDLSDSSAKTLTIADVETINLVSTEATADTTVTNTVVLAATSAKTLNITGTDALTFANTSSGFAKVTTVNATGLNAKLTASFSSAEQGVTVTVGSKGSDITGSGYADTLVGGAGADKFTGGALTDTITLGGGADNVVFTTFETSDKIKDFIQTGDNASAALLSTDVSAINAELAALAAASVLIDGDGTEINASSANVSGSYSAVLSGATLGASANIFGLKGASSKADAESLLATMAFASASGVTVQDGDGIMVAYDTANGIEFGVAVVQVSTLAIDSASIKVVGLLEGATLAQLASANFNFIA